MMRRWVRTILLLLLAGSVIGWILYMPPSTLNRLRPVPSHAMILYSSKTPALSGSSFPILGKTDSDFSRDWKKKFQWLEKFPLTVASVSLGGRDRRDTRVVVSALGRRALLLRWKLAFFPPEGVRPVRAYGGWPVWQLDDPELPAWARVRFSLAEGLLICSVSDDSHDLYWILDTLDGRRASLMDRKER